MDAWVARDYRYLREKGYVARAIPADQAERWREALRAKAQADAVEVTSGLLGDTGEGVWAILTEGPVSDPDIERRLAALAEELATDPDRFDELARQVREAPISPPADVIPLRDEPSR